MLNFQFEDRRLNNRGSLCLVKMIENPQVSFPKTFCNPGELQGFYRFINNERAELDAMMSAVENDTREQCQSAKSAIVIHDTTHVKPSAKMQSIEDFNFSAGFFAHLSLLVSAESLHQVYGSAAIKMWGRKEGKSQSEG